MKARVFPVLGSVCLLAGCGYRGELVGREHAPGPAGPGGGDFILGADLSWVQEEEDRGTVYVDGGAQEDVLVILRRHGFNYVRLRLFNDPGSPCRRSAAGDETCGYQHERAARAEPYCDLEHTVEMARRVKAAGMGLLLNFHYSDTWADPDDQNKPLSWEGLDFEALTVALESFTRDSLNALREADALPDMVQLGNGITPGLLFPDGSTSAPGGFARFAALIKAGIAGVEAVEPNIRIVLHIEKPDDFQASDEWLSNALAHGLDFDVLGQSCYEQWHGTPDAWRESFEQLAAKYPDFNFLVAEYSQHKREVNEMMFELPKQRGLGSFIWEPTQWGETLFDRRDGQLVANSRLALYDQMSADYSVR